MINEIKVRFLSDVELFTECHFLMILGLRGNFLKDFPLKSLLSPRCRAKANIPRAMTRRADVPSSESNTDSVIMTRRADTSRSKSNIGSVVIRLQLEQRRSVKEAIGNEDFPHF